MDKNIAFQTLRGLNKSLNTGELSPLKLVQFLLQRIKKFDNQLHSFISINNQAEHEAELLTKIGKVNKYAGLGGMPYAVKDMFHAKGLATTAGSRVLEDNMQSENAFVIDQAQRSGAILLGKLNLHEFAYGATGENSVYGTTRNPYDLERMAGGSSSGSAAAVAAGLVPVSLGTDTGGSVRVPASFCGLVGLKPTRGLISTNGVLPYCWSLDHVGIIARDALDCGVMLANIVGADQKDFYTPTVDAVEYEGDLKPKIKGLKVGVPNSFYFEGADPEILTATQNVLKRLEAEGAELVEVTLPSMEYARTVSLTIQMPEALSFHSRYLEQRGDLYGQDFRCGLALGQYVLAEQYIKAQRMLQVYRDQVLQVFDNVDIIVTPTTPVIAPKIGSSSIQVGDQEEVVGNLITKYTTFFNMSGNPALTVPMGLHSSGMPMGVQLIGRNFDEQKLLNIGHFVERFDEHVIPPPRQFL